MSYAVEGEYDVYSEKTIRARKAHTCNACGRTIEPGHYYCRVFYIWEGSKTSLKRCGACQRTHEHLRELDPGEMWPDETLSCGENYLDEWGNDPPAEVQALAFVTTEEAGALIGPLARLHEWAEAAGHRMERWHPPYRAVAFQRLANLGPGVTS